MKIVTIFVGRPLEACWKVFVDPTAMTHWVPGLVAAVVDHRTADGLPSEVRYEYTSELSYALVYTYDLDAHVVRWEPREAKRGGVRGFARFAVVDGGTEITYALEHDGGRLAAERALDDPKVALAAFAQYMHDS
jgi:hypothetical protein